MELAEILKTLCAETGISGEENSASQKAAELLKPYAQQVYLDDFNNVIAVIRQAQKDEPTVLLDAHIDEIGMIVTAIDESGFLHVSNCGGVDRRLLLGQEVTVYTSQGNLPGVSAPVEEEDKVPEMKEILIDLGMTKEEAEGCVRLGDRVGIRGYWNPLLGNQVSSKALDDRCGVAAILSALELLKEKELHCGVAVLFSAQEEVGEAGAKIAAFRLEPDIAIGLDVSFAKTPDAPAYTCGIMGKGPMIGIAPTLTRSISQRLIDLAEQHNIPYQVEVMGGRTGTNLDGIGIQKGGIRTGLISIPQKYMHTPIEVIDLQDLEWVAQLLAQYVQSVGGES
ncbi:MAG: M42 family metallopeptidase [Massiliimalia sp.]|jgi:putative aminopeptidase FrvX